MKTEIARDIHCAQASSASPTMKAAVVEEKNNIRLKEIPVPVLSPGEALIRVNFCGICGSDLHVLKGEHPTATFPVVSGHEFVGEVVEVCGEGAERFQSGDLVVAQPFFSCQNCEPCAKGRDNVCRSLRFLGAHQDGGFAEYVKVATRKMYKIPRTMDQQLAALAEPVAVAVHDVRRSGLQAGESVLIIGGGPIGLLIAIVARHAGASKVVVSEISEYRCQIARELGFETVNPLDATFDTQLMEATDSLGFNVVYEVSGSKPGVASATKYAKIAGTVVIIGMTTEPYPVDLSAVFAKELELRGVRIHAQYNFIGAIELLKNPKLQAEFSKLVTKIYPMEQIEEAFDYAQTHTDFMKILVEI